MTAIPRSRWPDESLRVLLDGYLFGERGFARAGGGDAFRTRLLGRPVTVLRGGDAVRFFYEGGRFDRSPGSVPKSVSHLLQDEGSVQSLEGESHRARKQMFLDIMLPEPARQELVVAFGAAWNRLAGRRAGQRIALLDFSADALSDAVQRWVGIDPNDDLALSTGELTSMIDNAGRLGPPNWLARGRRIQTERRVRALVERARSAPPSGTPLARIAHYTEGEGPLPVAIAAVELLNILRPAVAVARFVAFAGLALHRRPAWRDRLAGPDAEAERARYSFAQEVRRFFPFFPMIGGRATRQVEWNQTEFRRGDWVMIDLYGTDHLPTRWGSPKKFDPSRFDGMSQSPAVVAQGAGDFLSDHHCPGEPATNDLISESLRLLAAGPPYRVPEQDFRIGLRSFPAAPRDGFLVEFAPPVPP